MNKKNSIWIWLLVTVIMLSWVLMVFRLWMTTYKYNEVDPKSVEVMEVCDFEADGLFFCESLGGRHHIFKGTDRFSVLFQEVGDQYVVWGTHDWYGVKVNYCVVHVGGGSQPEPTPTPEPSGELSKMVSDAKVKYIPEAYWSICSKLSDNYREAAQKQFNSEEELLAFLIARNREVVSLDGTDNKKDAAFTQFLRSGGVLDTILIKQYPNGIPNWKPVLLEIAEGLK